MIYFIIILLFAFPVLFCDFKLWNYGESYARGNIYQKYYYFLYAIVVLLFGLRNFVGGDTIGYMNMWSGLPTLDKLGVFDFINAKYAPMWYIFNAVCKSINGEFWTFQIFHAIIVNAVIFYTISKYSNYRFTAILFFALSELLYFNCEILRESLSVSCGLLAFNYYVDKKWGKYYILALLALSFHKSAVCLLFLPLIYNYTSTKISNKQLAILVVCGFVFSTFVLPYAVRVFMPFFADSFEGYSTMHRASILGTLRSCLFVVLLTYLIKHYETSDEHDIVIVGTKFYLLAQVIGLFLPIFSTRFINYFLIYYIILLADFVWNHRGAHKLLVLALYANFLFGIVRQQTKDVSSWVSSTAHDYYFYEIYIPYYTIFEDIPTDVYLHRKAIYYQERLNDLKRNGEE